MEHIVSDISEVVGTEIIEVYDYIPISFNINSYTNVVNGITFVQNTDGTIHVYGTNTGSTSFYGVRNISGEILFSLSAGKKYRLSGCPSEGSASTYQLDLRLSSGGGGVCIDFGDGATIDVAENASYKMVIRVGGGVAIDAVFRPALDEVIVTQETVDEYSAIDKTVREELTEKIDVQQSVGDAGKVLTVGSDGIVFPAPASGITTRLRNAFASIFQHVAYTTEDASEYYDELIEALSGDDRKLVSISAVYDATGYTVYQYTHLDDLRDYLTVTALYDDNSTQEITDYTLSGELNSASSTITITYLSKSTTVIVSVSIDSSLAYYLTQDINLDGQSGVDTNYRTSDSNKALTIIGDFTDQDTATWAGIMTSSLVNVNGTATGFYASRDASTVDGARLTSYGLNARGSLSVKASGLTGKSHRVKFAMSHPANSRMTYFTLYVDGQMYAENKGIEGYEFVASTQTLIIGARPEGDRRFKGICHMCNIYNRQLSISEIKSVLEVA